MSSCSGCSSGRSGRVVVGLLAKVIDAFLGVRCRRLLSRGLGLGGGELRVHFGLLGERQRFVVTLSGFLFQGGLRLGVFVLRGLEFRQGIHSYAAAIGLLNDD